MNKNINKHNAKTDHDLVEQILVEATHAASLKAMRTSKALGLNIQFIEDGKIVEAGVNGKHIIRDYKISTLDVDLPKLKKGMTLERK